MNCLIGDKDTGTAIGQYRKMFPMMDGGDDGMEWNVGRQCNAAAV